MSYKTIKGLKSNEQFARLIEKLFLYHVQRNENLKLDEEETTYLLSCAIILVRAYDLDHSYKSYAEFAYTIILKVCLQNNAFEALYDFALNFGFYPISSAIANENMIDLAFITDEVSRRHIDVSFSHNDIIETFDQKKMRTTVTDEESNEVCLVAPTSYGKSTLIVEDLTQNLEVNQRSAIIVPTKSLLAQTHRMIKRNFPKHKAIIHDEMYMGENNFIAVLTQERALRMLLNNPALYFDKLYIDEAHNLFDRDARNVTLARVIKENRKRSDSSKIMYLSPLISNSDNLKHDINQDIVEQRIDFNVKEPDYFNYDLQGKVTLYNRYLDTFYDMEGSHGGYLDYTQANAGAKNFVYLYAPRKIEQFAQELSAKLDIISSDEIEIIIQNLAEHVHEDFDAINYLRKGVMYLHGRLPDNIKEYLEHKFSNTDGIKYMVANRVVLEGINLPIDTLFILNTTNLGNKDLTNLIGRVNRLNQIFSKPSRLDLLIPNIHFINNERYGRLNSNMQQKIRNLRAGMSEDKVENPLLYEFDFSQYNPDKEATKIKAAEKVLLEEEVFTSNPSNDIEKLMRSMVHVGLGTIYNLTPLLCETILSRLSKINSEQSIMGIVYDVFVKDLDEYIIDNEFSRLGSEGTRAYYDKYISEYRDQPFKKTISKQVASFAAMVKDPTKDNVIYLGEKLGEQTNGQGYKNLFVDLSLKTKPQLVNLAIAKLKLENDFINYKLLMVFQLLLDYGAITEDTYNQIVYGTGDKHKIAFIRLGLSLGVINKLESDNQFKNLSIDPDNRIVATDVFLNHLRTLDDLTAYEIHRVINE